MYMSMEVKGLKKLEKKLNGFEAKIGKKIMRKALRTGAKVVKQAQKTKATSVVGGDMGTNISRSIVVRSLKVRRKQLYRVSSMLNPNNYSLIHITQAGKRYYIPTAIEYGHANPGLGGTTIKDVAPKPFMRVAMNESESAAKRAVIQELKKGIEQQATLK